MPHVGHGYGQVFRKGAGTVYADAAGVLAELAPTGEAVTATPTHHMAFSAYYIANLEIVNVATDFYNGTDEFVSNDHWDGDSLLSPGVPVVDMQVCPADPRTVYFD